MAEARTGHGCLLRRPHGGRRYLCPPVPMALSGAGCPRLCGTALGAASLSCASTIAGLRQAFRGTLGPDNLSDTALISSLSPSFCFSHSLPVPSFLTQCRACSDAAPTRPPHCSPLKATDTLSFSLSLFLSLYSLLLAHPPYLLSMLSHSAPLPEYVSVSERD